MNTPRMIQPQNKAELLSGACHFAGNLCRASLGLGLALALVACGGEDGTSTPPPTGGNGGGGSGGGSGGSGGQTGTCALTEQLDFANDVLNQWYLFPSLLDDTVNPSQFADPGAFPDDFAAINAFLNARTAPAQATGRDEGFNFAVSASEEDALIASGSSAGIGIRLALRGTSLVILEAFENGPGFAAGMDRGTELLAIGTSASDAQSVDSLLASGGFAAVNDALGPTQEGVTRFIRFRTVDGTQVEGTITKTEFSLDPISDRYGVKILDDGGTSVGYINLRTFIVGDAERQLREAYSQFAAAGITELIIDFRYNGGGLVDIANSMGDFMGKDRLGDVWSRTLFNALRSDNNSVDLFDAVPESLRPSKIAFIGTSSTASASELVINSMLPYLDDSDIALIGEDTLGKPYGQSGFNFTDCDLRIRALTFETVNADDEGDYFNGIAALVPNTCRAADDINFALGDPREGSVLAALDFLGGRSCTDFAATARDTQAPQSFAPRQMLRPDRPTSTQYEVPGFY